MSYSVFPAPVASASKVYKELAFTSSTTWTKPDGVTYAEVLVVGGGGGGGLLGTTTTTYGGGGGGGNVILKTVALNDSNINVVVGAGGTYATNYGMPTNHGGYSLFGNDAQIWHNFLADFRGNVPFNTMSSGTNIGQQGLEVSQQLNHSTDYDSILGHSGYGNYQTSSSTTIETKRFFVEENTNYTIYYRAYNDSSPSTITYNVAYFNSSGTQISSGNLATYTMPNSVNTTTRNFTTPAGAVTARLLISSTATGNTTRISYIAVTKTSLGSAIYTRNTSDPDYEFYNDNATLWRVKRETSAFATGGGGGASRQSDQNSNSSGPTYGETTGGGAGAETAPSSPNFRMGAPGTGAGGNAYIDRLTSTTQAGSTNSAFTVFKAGQGWNRYSTFTGTGQEGQSKSIPVIKPGIGLYGYGYGGYGHSLPTGQYYGFVAPDGAIGYSTSRTEFAHRPNTGHGGYARLNTGSQFDACNGSSGLVIVRWYE